MAKTVTASFPEAVLIPKGKLEKSPSLKVGRPLTIIGSGDHVQIRFRSSSIRSLHAVLLNVDGRVILRGLGDNADLFVNDTQVREATLHAGDEIRLGSFTLVFQPGELATVSEPELPESACLLDQTGAAQAINRSIFLIGSNPDADLVLPESMSAHVLVLTIGRRRFTHLLDPDAPFQLNDSAQSRSPLKNGDVVRIGNACLQFEEGDAKVQPVYSPLATISKKSVVANAQKVRSGSKPTINSPVDESESHENTKRELDWENGCVPDRLISGIRGCPLVMAMVAQQRPELLDVVPQVPPPPGADLPVKKAGFAAAAASILTFGTGAWLRLR